MVLVVIAHLPAFGTVKSAFKICEISRLTGFALSFNKKLQTSTHAICKAALVKFLDDQSQLIDIIRIGGCTY